jgi:hypothetical protein
MDDEMQGYGILRYGDGGVYWGEFKNGMLWGEGVNQENGKLYREKYKENKRTNRNQIK